VNLHFTNPLSADSDADLLPDGYEVSVSCLDPLVFEGDTADDDSDGLENIHEYYGGLSGDGNTADPCDNAKPKLGAAGGGYFGEGDGNLQIGSADMTIMNLQLLGRNPDYTGVFPRDPLVQDLDGNLQVTSADRSILNLLLLHRQGDYVAGSPTELSLVAPYPPGSMEVGETVRVKVKLTKDGDKMRAGFGVVFKVVSGSGTLLGGEGIASGGGRYDLTAVDGVAQMVVRADGVGSLAIRVELPYDGEVHTRSVTLSPDVTIEVSSP